MKTRILFLISLVFVLLVTANSNTLQASGTVPADDGSMVGPKVKVLFKDGGVMFCHILRGDYKPLNGEYNMQYGMYQAPKSILAGWQDSPTMSIDCKAPIAIADVKKVSIGGVDVQCSSNTGTLVPSAAARSCKAK